MHVKYIINNVHHITSHGVECSVKWQKGWGSAMNIQKIFETLKLDQKNPALEIICGELEMQGYTVLVNGTPATPEKLVDCTFHVPDQARCP